LHPATSGEKRVDKRGKKGTKRGEAIKKNKQTVIARERTVSKLNSGKEKTIPIIGPAKTKQIATENREQGEGEESRENKKTGGPGKRNFTPVPVSQEKIEHLKKTGENADQKQKEQLKGNNVMAKEMEGRPTTDTHDNINNLT